MDANDLTILIKEMEADCAVARATAQEVARHLSLRRYETSASEFSRFCKVLERILERIFQSYENEYRERGVNREMLQKNAPDLKERIRREFVPTGSMDCLWELDDLNDFFLKAKPPKFGYAFAFRHGSNKMSYDNFMKSAAIAGRISVELPTWVADFETNLRKRKGWI